MDAYQPFRSRGRARLPAPDEAVAFAREIREPERHPFSTPSGKIEIYSMAIAAKPDPYGLGAIPAIPTVIPEPPDARHPPPRVPPAARPGPAPLHANPPVRPPARRPHGCLHPPATA